MTAEDAALTWFRRCEEIEQEYKLNPNAADLTDQANLAARGISALLQHRYTELSTATVDRLGLSVDRLAKIAAATLDASLPSPWRAALVEAGDSIKEDLNHWKESAKNGGRAVLDAAGDLKWAIIALAVVGLLLAARK